MDYVPSLFLYEDGALATATKEIQRWLEPPSHLSNITKSIDWFAINGLQNVNPTHTFTCRANHTIAYWVMVLRANAVEFDVIRQELIELIK